MLTHINKYFYLSLLEIIVFICHKSVYFSVSFSFQNYFSHFRMFNIYIILVLIHDYFSAHFFPRNCFYWQSDSINRTRYILFIIDRLIYILSILLSIVKLQTNLRSNQALFLKHPYKNYVYWLSLMLSIFLKQILKCQKTTITNKTALMMHNF